ncbi:hypothetical protein LCGC14_1629510 [marine sediment metagenome]|uniref:Uncharacterized protein n=1 Tax=marine sediment metagenome TaxID=412755 RepID=A0A0F9I365_9ZZZZ
MKASELLELLKFVWKRGEVFGLYGIDHSFKDINEEDVFGLNSTLNETLKKVNKKLLCKGLTLYELRGNYTDYLIKNYKCTEKECQEAWIKVQKHFPIYNPESGTQRLILEVAVRDMIDGVFIPKLAEVENID